MSCSSGVGSSVNIARRRAEPAGPLMRALRGLVVLLLAVALGCAGPAPVVEPERPVAPPPQPLEQAPADDVVVTPLDR